MSDHDLAILLRNWRSGDHDPRLAVSLLRALERAGLLPDDERLTRIEATHYPIEAQQETRTSFILLRPLVSRVLFSNGRPVAGRFTDQLGGEAFVERYYYNQQYTRQIHRFLGGRGEAEYAGEASEDQLSAMLDGVHPLRGQLALPRVNPPRALRNRAPECQYWSDIEAAITRVPDNPIEALATAQFVAGHARECLVCGPRVYGHASSAIRKLLAMEPGRASIYDEPWAD